MRAAHGRQPATRVSRVHGSGARLKVGVFGVEGGARALAMLSYPTHANKKDDPDALLTSASGLSAMNRLFESLLARVPLATLGLAVSVGVTACGGQTSPASISDADAGDASSVSDEAARVCSATWGQYVTSFESCCSAADRDTTSYAQIVAGASGWCEAYLQASLSKGRVRVDADRLATCAGDVSGYLAAHPGCWPTPNRYPHPPTAMASASCRAAVVGLVAETESCRVDYECADGLTCVGWTNDSDGTCKRPPSIGESCAYGLPDAATFSITSYVFPFGAHPGCAIGAYCDRTCKPLGAASDACLQGNACAVGLVCVEQRCTASGFTAEGGACLANSDCVDRTYCARAAMEPAGRCTAKRSAGAACANKSECLGLCDAASGTCAAFCGAP